MQKNAGYLSLSGLNTDFPTDIADFGSYCSHYQKIILTARENAAVDASEKTVLANCPYQLTPTQPNGKAMLFIHGLFDSPYYFSYIAKFFQRQGYSCHSILLPGHGSVPGDLLKVKASSWQQALQFGIENLKQTSQEIYLCGFSLGAALAIQHCQAHTDIAGLYLFAPGIRSRSLKAGLIAKLYPLYRHFSGNHHYLQKKPQINPVKYESMTYNGIYQALKTLAKVQLKDLKIPIFIACVDSDETVCFHAILNFFAAQTAKKQLLIYSNNKQSLAGKNIIVKNSAYPEKNILDFSHTCLSIPASDPLLGENGSYQDFLHYNDIPTAKNIFYGAIHKKNLAHHPLARLSYNPDFDNMLELIQGFTTVQR